LLKSGERPQTAPDFIRRIAMRFSAIGSIIFHRKVLKRLLLTIVLVLFYNPVYIFLLFIVILFMFILGDRKKSFIQNGFRKYFEKKDSQGESPPERISRA